jgi:hypothetical protein
MKHCEKYLKEIVRCKQHDAIFRSYYLEQKS